MTDEQLAVLYQAYEELKYLGTDNGKEICNWLLLEFPELIEYIGVDNL